MNERVSVAVSGVMLFAVTLACKSKPDAPTPAAASAPVVATETAPVASSAPAASASEAPAPSATVVVKAKPTNTCHGLMLNKRCARQCMGDNDCPDPKERCAPFMGTDDDGQDVQGAVVCQYDKDNEPRAAVQTVGVAAPKGGDCPDGWSPSVSEADKCDKECKSDGECGPGNKCKAVGPQGSGKQCQKG